MVLIPDRMPIQGSPLVHVVVNVHSNLPFVVREQAEHVLNSRWYLVSEWHVVERNHSLVNEIISTIERKSREHRHDTYVPRRNFLRADRHVHLRHHRRRCLRFDRFQRELLHVEHDFDDIIYLSRTEKGDLSWNGKFEDLFFTSCLSKTIIIWLASIISAWFNSAVASSLTDATTLSASSLLPTDVTAKDWPASARFRLRKVGMTLSS